MSKPTPLEHLKALQLERKESQLKDDYAAIEYIRFIIIQRIKEMKLHETIPNVLTFYEVTKFPWRQNMSCYSNISPSSYAIQNIQNKLKECAYNVSDLNWGVTSGGRYFFSFNMIL